MYAYMIYLIISPKYITLSNTIRIIGWSIQKKNNFGKISSKFILMPGGFGLDNQIKKQFSKTKLYVSHQAIKKIENLKFGVVKI